ncbi:MAG: RT0821/Lpp0805 family surface protein [Candidatus Tectimicrobiota bacterium]
MNKRWKKWLGIVLMLSFVTACAAPPGPKSTVGGLGGAAAGGLLGATLGGGAVGTAAGVILGGLLGGAIGDRLDAADQRHVQHAAYRAFENEPVGTVTPWRNPDTGHYGTITPTNTYRTAEGIYCREYQQTIHVGGERQQGYGTACRQPDGRWQIVE